LLIKDLHEQQNMDFSRIQDALALGPTVVRRTYNTLKAFEQMREDEEYDGLANRELFSLFLEMLSRPTLRTWLDWSDEELCFRNNTNRQHMYQLIVVDHSEEDDVQPAINNPQDMRNFAKILGHEYRDRVFDRLLNGDITIAQSWAILEPGTTPWEEMVSSVTQALEKLSADELQSLGERDQLLLHLQAVIGTKLDQALKLQS